MRIGYFRMPKDTFFNTDKDVFMKIKQDFRLDALHIELDDKTDAFENLLMTANKGDIIVIDEFATLCFNIYDFYKKVNRIISNGLFLQSVNDNFTSITKDGMNCLLFLDKLIQSEKSSKNKNVKRGRPYVPIDMVVFKELYPQWKNKKITAVFFMRKLGIKPNTFYRTVANYEAKNGKKG